MKKLILALLIIGGMWTSSFAQNYNSAVGLRLGYPVSVSYKKFLSEKNALEVFGGIRNRSLYKEFRVNAGYLIHNPIKDIDRLSWYYGGGAGLVIYSFDSPNTDGGASIALNGYLGLEYTIDNIPLTFSIDWIPTFSLTGYKTGGQYGLGAIAARYILN